MISPMMGSIVEKCVLLTKSARRDGQGGTHTAWTDGAEFDAWFDLDSSTSAQIAEQQGVKSLYTIYVSRDAPVAALDAFRRVSDGATFRVTSDGADKRTPPTSALDMRQYKAERWVLPT
jgi:hypothetical protein